MISIILFIETLNIFSGQLNEKQLKHLTINTFQMSSCTIIKLKNSSIKFAFHIDFMMKCYCIYRQETTKLHLLSFSLEMET